MLHWKNRPIDDLSELELRVALTESMMHVLSKRDTDDESVIFQAFISGTFFGLVVTGIAISVAAYF